MLKKRFNGYWVVLIFGLILLGVGLLPTSFNATEQCPGSALSMPDGSHCIVGAPIGPPIWLIGLVIACVGIAGLLFNWLRRKK